MSSTSSTSSSGRLQIGGLVSGIDTAGLISSLMSVAARPQQLLEGKLSVLTTKLSALQDLNKQGASLKSTASSLASASTWLTTTATSSSSATTAATVGLPPKASVTFDVVKTATSHTVTTDLLPGTNTGTPPSIVLSSAGGTTTTINPASWSAKDIAAAVNNASGGGYSATVLHGSDGDRVLMSSTATGDDSAFTTTGLSTTVLTTGHDAELDIGGGGTYVHSPTNTFRGLLSGVDVTVTKPESGVTITVGQDQKGLASQVSGLVDAMNAFTSSIEAATKAVPATSTTKNGSGPLVGNTTVSSIAQQLLSTASGALAGDSAATAGVQVQADGTLTFDAAKFGALLQDDPAKAQALVTALATKVKTVTTQSSDPFTGSLTREISSDNDQSTSLSDQISDWDRRLDLRQQTLQNQYDALESALSKLQSQSSALSGLLSSSS